jgi:predicted nucleic acid-binding protein
VRIVNASPLIVLARVGLLELLREPSNPVVVPDIVYWEVLAGERFDPHVQALREAATDWLQVVPVPRADPSLDQNLLDAGELAVLTLALQNPGATVVLDDHAARATALQRNIPLVGTAGILLQAKRDGRITSVRPILDALKEAGLYLSDDLYRLVLKLAGD